MKITISQLKRIIKEEVQDATFINHPPDPRKEYDKEIGYIYHALTILADKIESKLFDRTLNAHPDDIKAEIKTTIHDHVDKWLAAHRLSR